MQHKERAVACFKQGLSCSQAILATFSERLGLERDMAMKVAAGFGGGMGRMASTCGAVTGSSMVIGLKYGSARADDRDAKERTYAKVQGFARQFCERHRWLECKKLLGCDISSAEGMKLAKDKKLFVSLCP